MTIALQHLTLKEARETPGLMRILFALTLRGSSEMRNEIHRTCSDELANKYEIVLARSCEGRVVGWVMSFPSFWYEKDGRRYCSSKYYSYFYVARAYRELGIGTKLFNAAREICENKSKRMLCVPWDVISRNFFVKNKANIDHF